MTGLPLAGLPLAGQLMDGWVGTAFWGLVCLAVPVAWGIVTNRVFERLSRRPGGSRHTAPPEYHI